MALAYFGIPYLTAGGSGVSTFHREHTTHQATHRHGPWGSPYGTYEATGRGAGAAMVSSKLMAAAVLSNTVASAVTTAAEIAAVWWR